MWCFLFGPSSWSTFLVEARPQHFILLVIFQSKQSSCWGHRFSNQGFLPFLLALSTRTSILRVPSTLFLLALVLSSTIVQDLSSIFVSWTGLVFQQWVLQPVSPVIQRLLVPASLTKLLLFCRAVSWTSQIWKISVKAYHLIAWKSQPVNFCILLHVFLAYRPSFSHSPWCQQKARVGQSVSEKGSESGWAAEQCSCPCYWEILNRVVRWKLCHFYVWWWCEREPSESESSMKYWSWSEEGTASISNQYAFLLSYRTYNKWQKFIRKIL